MKITLPALRETAEILFAHLDSQGLSEFEIDDDYYWTLAVEQLYDPTKQPSEFGLEQLTDNWEWLERVRTGAAEPITYQLVWLAAFLRWIGQRKQERGSG